MKKFRGLGKRARRLPRDLSPACCPRSVLGDWSRAHALSAVCARRLHPHLRPPAASGGSVRRPRSKPDAGTVPWFVTRAHRLRPVPALVACTSRPRPRLLGGFAGGFGLEGRGASAFPQVGDVCSEPRPQQAAQKPRLMSKSGPIFCKTVQKSWSAGIGHRAVAVEADFRAPVCAMEGCTLPGSPSLCFCSVKQSCLIMWSWRASRGSVGASAGPPRFPSFPPLPARRLSFASSPYSESGGNTRLQSLSGMG